MQDLINRLLTVEHGRSDKFGVATNWYRNPDGPEAAQQISKLLALLSRELCTCGSGDPGIDEHGPECRFRLSVTPEA